MKVHWTANAISHLTAIHEYVSLSSEKYAQRMVDQLTNRSVQISSFPLSGRMVPEFENENIREVFEGNYRIIYYIKSDQIDVLAVVHGTQQLQSDVADT